MTGESSLCSFISLQKLSILGMDLISSLFHATSQATLKAELYAVIATQTRNLYVIIVLSYLDADFRAEPFISSNVLGVCKL